MIGEKGFLSNFFTRIFDTRELLGSLILIEVDRLEGVGSEDEIDFKDRSSKRGIEEYLSYVRADDSTAYSTRYPIGIIRRKSRRITAIDHSSHSRPINSTRRRKNISTTRTYCHV